MGEAHFKARGTEIKFQNIFEKNVDMIYIQTLPSILGDDSGDSYNAINPPVVVKPKDKKKIRKAREQKLIKQRLLRAKMEKKKVTDIHR